MHGIRIHRNSLMDGPICSHWILKTYEVIDSDWAVYGPVCLHAFMGLFVWMECEYIGIHWWMGVFVHTEFEYI